MIRYVGKEALARKQQKNTEAQQAANEKLQAVIDYVVAMDYPEVLDEEDEEEEVQHE